MSTSSRSCSSPPGDRSIPLASQLDELTRLVGSDDDLFPLFADRVRRSAEQGLALVTLFDQL